MKKILLIILLLAGQKTLTETFDISFFGVMTQTHDCPAPDPIVKGKPVCNLHCKSLVDKKHIPNDMEHCVEACMGQCKKI